MSSNYTFNTSPVEGTTCRGCSDYVLMDEEGRMWCECTTLEPNLLEVSTLWLHLNSAKVAQLRGEIPELIEAENFERSLTSEQREKMQHSGECCGCVKFIGNTSYGENTYRWHYGVSNGYVVLPFGEDAHVEFDFNTSSFYCWDPAEQEVRWSRSFSLSGRETTENEDVLVHARMGHFREAGILDDQFRIGGFLPERVTEKFPGINPDKYAHAFLRPDEVTPRLMKKAIAITHRYRDGREIVAK